MLAASPSSLFVLAAANFAAALLVVGLSIAPQSSDRTVYVVFPPWNDVAEDASRIAGAGGRTVGGPLLRSIFKVVLEDDRVLARLGRTGPYVAFAADRRPICSSSKRA